MRTPLFLSCLFLLALAALLPCPARAQEAAEPQGPVLFGSHRAGEPRQAVAGLPGVYDCSADLGPEALCLDGAEYLERDWALDFAFADGRLAAVGLVRPFDHGLYLDVFAAVTKRSALVAMQTEAESLDLVRLLAENPDGQRFSDTVTAFEAEGMRAARLAYVFLDKASIAPLADKAGDLPTLTVWAGPGLVRTVLVLYAQPADGRTDGQSDWLAVQFEAPSMTDGP